MKIEDFEILAKERFAYCLNLMIGPKHKEYSRGGDKLHNFKAAAIIDRESPERALWGMLKKTSCLSPGYSQGYQLYL